MRYLLQVIASSCALLHLHTIEGVEGFTSTTYEELEQLNATCSPRDTCVPFPEKEYDTLDHRYCECDSHCTRYKTCCVDSPYIGSYEEHKANGSDTSECFNIPGTTKSYFMVTKCPREWNGSSEVTNLCEEVQDLRDPFILAPATYGGLTYKNFFCALCHGADSQEIKLWDISVTKSVSGGVRSQVDENYKRDLLDQLVFDESVGKWGRMEAIYGSKRFSTVDIDFVPASGVEVRPCISHLIYDCDPEWKNEEIRNKCLSYMAAIYVKSKLENSSYSLRTLRYRNVHCAICNFVSQESGKACVPRWWGGGSWGHGSRFSFTMLLDINPSDGKRVGKVSRCKEGEAYDNFFKKCRTLLCALPGFVMKGDRCVKT